MVSFQLLLFFGILYTLLFLVVFVVSSLYDVAIGYPFVQFDLYILLAILSLLHEFMKPIDISSLSLHDVIGYPLLLSIFRVGCRLVFKIGLKLILILNM